MTKFIVSTAFLTAKFNEFNAKYFNNEIPMVSWGWLRRENTLGMYKRGLHKILITRNYDDVMTQHDCEEILIHEMVHAWQTATNHRDTGSHCHHGNIFYMVASRINRESNNYFHISRCTTLEHNNEHICSAKGRKSSNVSVFVCTNANSTRVDIGRVSNDSVKSFKEWLEKKHYDKIVVCRMLDVDKFAHLVTSRSRFNYHTYSQSEFVTKFKPYLEAV